jgi:ribosomal protein L19E
LQNFSNLRMTRAVTPGKISPVTRKELSAVVAECAARTEQAAARTKEAAALTKTARAEIEVSRAGIEAARAKQEEAIVRQEAITAEIEKLRPVWERERAEFRESMQESKRNTEKILVELKEGRDERRAMLEALFKVMDRLPPPPPNLRSA